MTLCMDSVQIDDFNDHIVYSGPWQSFTNQTYGFNGTRHVATAPGLSANFKFNGSCIFVNGIVGTNGTSPMPPTTFILDGHFTQMNASVTNGAPFPNARGFAQSVLYIALTLTEGEHELIITNLGANASAPLVLDGFIITPLKQQTSSSSSATSSSTSSSSTSTAPTLPTASPSPTPPPPTQHPGSHTGAIVGGVVGGVCGLALVLIIFLVWRYRSRHNNPTENDIRPFAAWRGTAGASASATAFAEKQTRAQLVSQPGLRGDAASSASGPSAAAPAAPPDVTGLTGNSNERFYGDRKVRPPGYVP
ncbi:hypothetical protein C8Q77DRAFT_1188251 [Trametes polyzona]|nr:hypothetical protein C8Q77DRAFT_1188251 [Trametes polyzona]